MNKWYIENGDQGDVVISTRVRLARNLEEYPFPCRLTVKGKEKVCEEIKNAVLSDDHWGFGFTWMKDFTRSQAVSLAERHLVSPEFVSDRAGRGLLLTDDEAISIMLCEEDHIRLQVMMAGLALKEAYSVADKVDNIIGSKLNYAYDDRIGYLTQCPTNLGTAMRASVMLHLPALTRCGQIGKLAATVSKLGLVIRGAYGEGSSPRGDIYQLSNQITLGISEETALDNLQSITLQLVAQERAAAEKLLENPAEEDKIFRARVFFRTQEFSAAMSSWSLHRFSEWAFQTRRLTLILQSSMSFRSRFSLPQSTLLRARSFLRRREISSEPNG